MFFSKDGSQRLLGAIGVYVDDFLFVESEDEGWKVIMRKNKWCILFRLGHDYDSVVLCGVQYRQHPDWSVSMDQREYVEGLSPHDFQPDYEIKHLKDHDVSQTPKWIKRLRGAKWSSPMVVFKHTSRLGSRHLH